MRKMKLYKLFHLTLFFHLSLPPTPYHTCLFSIFYTEKNRFIMI